MKEISWEGMYKVQAPRLLGLCRRYVKDVQTAEDLMHDAFLTAIRKQQQFANQGAFEGWLHKIALNTVLMYMRQEKQFRHLLEEDRSWENWEPDDEDRIQDPRETIFAAGFDKDDLLQALDVLPAHHKVVFNLYVFEAFSHKQIAESLGISAGTSKSHLARARKKLQEILLQKAQQMSEKEKRAAIFIFPFQPKQESFVDELYQQKLAGHQIQPQKPLPGNLSEALKSNSSIRIKAKTIWAKPVFWGALAAVGCVSVLTLMRPSSGQTVAGDLSYTTADTTSLVRTQTLLQIAVPETKSEVKAEKSVYPERPLTSRPEPDQPVVLKKTVVVKDTVYQVLDQHEE